MAHFYDVVAVYETLLACWSDPHLARCVTCQQGEASDVQAEFLCLGEVADAGPQAHLRNRATTVTVCNTRNLVNANDPRVATMQQNGKRNCFY